MLSGVIDQKKSYREAVACSFTREKVSSEEFSENTTIYQELFHQLYAHVLTQRIVFYFIFFYLLFFLG